MWLIETSTDPEVFHAAASLVPDVDWPLHLDVSGTLHQLYDAYTTCLDVRGQIIPSLENKASACTMALCHLYCHRILQGRPACGFRGEGHADVYVFQEMSHRTKVNYDVFAATNNLFVTNYEESHYPLSSLEFGACPDSVPLLEWLSRVLPFYFVTGGMSEVGKELAITVISKILCSPSPPPQIMANCTLLACVMVGVQFDKKDVVRIDKSSALHELAWSLWTQFEKVWTSDRGHPLLDKYNMGIRQEWILLDTICRMNELDIISPILSHMMWVVGVCRKIYSWARSSQHNDSTSALVKVQCFRFTIESSQDGPYPTEPAWLWNHQIAWQGDPHSPEDFDWLVDYLGDVCSNDYETAGDILVLLNSMGVSCSPAKQRLYIEKLIACMGSNMPPRLRHAALYAAHIFREVLTFIDVVDDADVILTNLSHSILTAVRPRPGATPTYDSVIWNAIPTNDDDPDFFFHRDRDRRYLELIFSLARNSHWRPHLHCQIDRAIGMIAICCNLDDWHAYFLVGFFCQMTSEEVSATSLSSITEQQWWDMIRLAWNLARYTTDDTHGVEFLLVLVERTKKHMRFTSIYYLEQLIYNVDAVIGELEKCLLEQKEAVADAMKELKVSYCHKRLDVMGFGGRESGRDR
ncbi:hypothetical protein BDR04DRAFT_232354 [Suillus decipiens]|nr:hypothetical protein BDR04DRAFT_232354 [Suillus decipiens]